MVTLDTQDTQDTQELPMVKYDRKQDERDLWDYHEEWETYTAYQRFVTYYLAQQNPRTLLAGYREYCKRERNISEEKIQSYKSADATWSKWAAGDKDKNIPPWKERASAYDVEMISRFQANKENMRLALLQDNLERVNRLAERWDEFYMMSELMKTTSTNTIPLFDDKGEKVGEQLVKTMALNVGQFRSLVRALDDITIQQRRVLGLPSEIRQNNIADNEGGKMEWGTGLVDTLAPMFQQWQQRKRKQSKDDE